MAKDNDPKLFSNEMRKAMSYLKMKAEEKLSTNEMQNSGLADGVDEIN